MKIVFTLVSLIVLLTLWLEKNQLVSPAGVAPHSVFWIQSIDKSLPHYHAYTAIDEKKGRQVYLRCFGFCLPVEVGQLWSMRYRVSSAVSKHCLHFLCQHNYWRDKKLTIIDGRRAQLVGSKPIKWWQRHHENYLQLLSAWFDDQATIAVFSALTLNDKRFFSRDVWQVFKNTGTSHLVAMSGLHVGLLITLVGRLVLSSLVFLFPFFTDKWIHWLRSLLVLLVAVALFLWVNPSSSIERALLMFAGSVIAMGFNVYLSLKKWWVIAAVVLLLLNPGVVFEVGAWLSFLTVWVLIRYSQPLTQYESLWVASVGRCGLVFVFLLPLSLYFFHAASLWSPLINMVAVPWFSLSVIPLLVLSLFSSFVSVTLAKYLAWLASVFFKPIWLLLQQAAQLPGGQLTVSAFPLPVCVLLLLVAIWAVDRLFSYNLNRCAG